MAAPEDLMDRLRSEATGCYSWSNGASDRYAAHSHDYEKVLYCVEGSITFTLEADGRRLLLGPGDRMVLPAGTVHSAVVGHTGCTCIEGRR
jgi:mannose-6-phosphate isomerase-like protein (cupin superfamily)